MLKRILRARRRAGRRSILALAALATLLCALPATASAATIPTAATHAAPAADYRGWAYVTNADGGANVGAWKWAAEGWQSATWTTGASVWLYPWGQGWTWAWRDGAWHAIQTANTATWSCSAVEGDQDVYPKALRTNVDVYRYNASNAATVAAAELNDRIQLLCGNGFRDAAGTTKVYALVRVTSYTWCQIFTFDCVIAPPVKTTVTGYVDVNSLSETPVAPPEGTFGEFPQ